MTNVQRADEALQELMRLLPAAWIMGALEEWARLYTEGYMIKLRCMR